MANKRGRPRLKTPKAQARLNVEYLHLLPPLKTAMSPRGLSMTNAQAIDVLIATMHELLVERKGIVVDTDKMIDVLNGHFRRTFSAFLAETLTAFGHEDVATSWREDGSVKVECAGGTAVVPEKVFAGDGLDRDGLLRELKATTRVN